MDGLYVGLGLVAMALPFAVATFFLLRYRFILRINEYFVKAATVYVLVGDEDAHLAAEAAAERASPKIRIPMRAFVRKLGASFATLQQVAAAPKDSRRLWDRQVERCARLTAELDGKRAAEGAKPWDELRINNGIYAHALPRPGHMGDPTVFVRRYPQLFGAAAERALAAGAHPDETSEGLIAEAHAMHAQTQAGQPIAAP